MNISKNIPLKLKNDLAKSYEILKFVNLLVDQRIKAVLNRFYQLSQNLHQEILFKMPYKMV